MASDASATCATGPLARSVGIHLAAVLAAVADRMPGPLRSSEAFVAVAACVTAALTLPPRNGLAGAFAGPAATSTILRRPVFQAVGVVEVSALGVPDGHECERQAPSPPGLPRAPASASALGVAWSSSGGGVVEAASPAFPPPPPTLATSTTVLCDRVRYQPPAAAPATATRATAVAAGRLRAQRPWRVGGIRCSMCWAARRHQGRFTWCRAASASERGMGPCAAGDQYRGGSPWSEASRSRAVGCGLRGWALPCGAFSGVLRSMPATVDLRKVRIPLAIRSLWITPRTDEPPSPIQRSGTRE